MEEILRLWVRTCRRSQCYLRGRAKTQIQVIRLQTQYSYPLPHHKSKPHKMWRQRSPHWTLWVTGAVTFIRIITFSFPPQPPNHSFTQTNQKKLLRLSHHYLNPMRTNELPIRVLIGDFFLPQSHPVAPVQRADVILYSFCHFIPVMFNCTRKEDIMLSFSTAWRRWFLSNYSQEIQRARVFS